MKRPRRELKKLNANSAVAMVPGRGRFPVENIPYRGNSDPSPGNSQRALCWMRQLSDLLQPWETEKGDFRGKQFSP